VFHFPIAFSKIASGLPLQPSAILTDKIYAVVGEEKNTHASNPENRFTLFGIGFRVATHLIPKTGPHFLGCVFEFPRILSENRFTLFGMGF